MREEAAEDAEQEVIDNYPAGTTDPNTGRKSRNKSPYGKPAKYANGGLIGLKYKK